MRRDGLRSSPSNLCICAETLGLLRSPSRRKAAPTGPVPALRVMQASWWVAGDGLQSSPGYLFLQANSITPASSAPLWERVHPRRGPHRQIRPLNPMHPQRPLRTLPPTQPTHLHRPQRVNLPSQHHRHIPHPHPRGILGVRFQVHVLGVAMLHRSSAARAALDPKGDKNVMPSTSQPRCSIRAANKKGCHSAAFSMLSPDDQSQLKAPPV
ncbi:hypothetical protein IAE39_004993 [Pseudomonas sp. S37]|nr:hypothetical protein [Pseudomonas sp. S37]